MTGRWRRRRSRAARGRARRRARGRCRGRSGGRRRCADGRRSRVSLLRTLRPPAGTTRRSPGKAALTRRRGARRRRCGRVPARASPRLRGAQPEATNARNSSVVGRLRLGLVFCSSLAHPPMVPRASGAGSGSERSGRVTAGEPRFEQSGQQATLAARPAPPSPRPQRPQPVRTRALRERAAGRCGRAGRRRCDRRCGRWRRRGRPAHRPGRDRPRACAPAWRCSSTGASAADVARPCSC